MKVRDQALLFIAVIWLPSGIAILGLILYGYRAIPAILLSALVANTPFLIHTETMDLLLRSGVHSVVSAIIDTAQATIGYAFYRRLIPNGVLHDMPAFMTFVMGVSVLPSMLTAWVSIVNLHLGGYIDPLHAIDWKNHIYNLTTAYAFGIFLLVPLYESFQLVKWSHIRRTEIIRFGYMILFLGIVFYWLFFREIGYPVAMILPLTVIALLGGILGTSIVFLVVGVTSIVLTLNGVGPFIISMAATSTYGLIYVMIGLGIPTYLIAISTHNSTKLNLELDKRVKERTKELAELNRNKDHLMSIIAHDLRNPIQAIIGVSDLMKQDVKTSDYSEVGSYSKIISGSAKQIMQLLYNLLDWSSTQSELMQFSPKWINLNLLIAESFAYCKEMADSKSIHLNTDIPMRYQAFVDAKMMATILRNLTSNALKFTPEGGTVQIKVTPLDTNGFRLSVTDTGVGMTADQQTKLFRIDHDSQPKRGTGGEIGSGIGLMLCKTFIDKHNAQLSIHSEPGKGSEFHLTFPAIYPVT